MTTKDLLQDIQNFLYSGRYQSEFVPDPVVRILNACMLFERHLYKHFGQVTKDNFNNFYNQLYQFTSSITLDKFQEASHNLEPWQKEIILRNLGKILENCTECEMSSYVKILIN